MESINYWNTPYERAHKGDFYCDFMGWLTSKKQVNECKYCGHSLVESDDPMICSECNSWQGKTQEEIGEELSDLERGN